MAKEMAVKTDPLFVALTRAPTIFGVTYTAFVIEGMLAGILLIGGGLLHTLWILPVHAIFYLICTKDPGIFAELAVWVKTYGRCLNKKFWGATSFSPLVVKKWK